MTESDKRENSGSKRSAHAKDQAEAAAAAAVTTDVATSAEQPPIGVVDEPRLDATDAESPELQETRQQLETARKRVDELARAYQAVSQDKEEFKSRLTRERDRMIDVEKGNVALVLLEAIDELDLSIRAAGEDASPLAKGVRMIRDGIVQKLANFGVERIPVLDLPYNPNTAEAFDMEITADAEQDGWVLDEIRGGYRMKDRIIRPARVKVAKYVKPADA